MYCGTKTHTTILLGAQPSWEPPNWSAIIACHASLRVQLNRARNKDEGIELWPSEHAERSLEFKTLLHGWLWTPGLPPLHLLVEPETLGQLRDREYLLRPGSEVSIGFLVASPMPEERAADRAVRARA